MRHILLSALVLAAPVSAETLPDAIASAYATNPQIAAARAQLRQIDETAPLASAATRPRLDLQGNFTQNLTDSFGDLGRIWSGGVVLRQSIWEGGRVRAGISSAQARILAARSRLLAVEYQVVADTVVAYADVLKTQAVVRLNDGQVKLLEEQLRASRDRFEVGDLTRTDVAQSEARLAFARANLMAARGQETVARQAYRRLVGRDPVNLAPLPALPPIPDSEERSRTLALESNPGLMASRLEERATRDDVAAAKAGRLPSIGLQGSANYLHYEGPGQGLSGFDPRIGVSAAMPLFTGGQIAARVRQAQARQSEALEQIAQTERLVIEAATDNWALLRTAEAVIESARVQIDANTLAAEGVRQENQVGSRDILDVLNAEQELLNARVALVQAERDRYAAAFQLLETIGDIAPVLEGASVTRYDAAANAKRVKAKGWDEFGYDPDPRLDRTRNHAQPMMGPQQ